MKILNGEFFPNYGSRSCTATSNIYSILHSSVLLVMFNVILCRFIPDDVTFDDHTATSSCSDADIAKDYQPSE